MLTASTLALTLALGAAAASAETWDMPVAYPASNFHTENAVEFAACVGERTGGELEVVVHPNGALFSGTDIKRAVQTGQAPIGERLLSAHENENKLFGIDAVPFLATSFEASDKLWNAARPKLEEALAAQDLVYLYAAPWPPQGLYTKKPVESVADLQGVKFRAYNAATSRIAELAGLIPVQIEAAELSQALATGVAESFISSGSTGVDSKVWESLTHWYDVQAWLPRNVVFANKSAFEALDDATRAALTECGDEAAARGTAAAMAMADDMIAELRANGMTVEPPSDQLRAELEGFGQTMTDEFLAETGADGQAIIDAYRAE
ncbi:C4-dicarboxylate ABC transporter substrate-binding protein [Paracoccus sp. S-4012]|nr:C4-dicarboxylate ABC transporter substrate-binding protein [Paracoccus sp. S-4012]